MQESPLPRDPVEAAQVLAARLAAMNFTATMHGRLRLVDLVVRDRIVPRVTVLTLAPDRQALLRGTPVPTVEPEAENRIEIDLQRSERIEKAA